MPQPCEAKVEWTAPDFLVKSMTPEYLKLEAAFPSFVYVIQSGDDGPIKIGSANRPSRRIGNLQTSSWQDLYLRAAIPAHANVGVEKAAHVLARDHAIRGEWFDLSPYEAVCFVLEAMKLLGIQAVPLKPLVTGLRPERPWRSTGGPDDIREARQAAMRRKLGVD